jgi:hypothetical protein
LTPFSLPFLGCFIFIKFGRVSSLKLALNQQEVLIWHIKTAGKSHLMRRRVKGNFLMIFLIKKTPFIKRGKKFSVRGEPSFSTPI